MTNQAILALCMVGALAACGRVAESRFNPINWFGRSAASDSTATQASIEAQTLVAQVVTLRAEAVPGGAILRATGLPQRQGYFDGQLVQITSADPGILAFEFQIEEPFGQTQVGPQQSREVLVGMFLTEQTLAGVRQIRVSGAANALTIRR